MTRRFNAIVPVCLGIVIRHIVQALVLACETIFFQCSMLVDKALHGPGVTMSMLQGIIRLNACDEVYRATSDSWTVLEGTPPLGNNL